MRIIDCEWGTVPPCRGRSRLWPAFGYEPPDKVDEPLDPHRLYNDFYSIWVQFLGFYLYLAWK